MGIRPGQAKGPFVGPLDTNASWLEPVIALFDPTTAFPVAPAIGDRYLATATATHGGVTWTQDNLYEWNGITWTETSPVDGMVVFVKQLNQLYAYAFSAWRLYQDFWFKPVIAMYDNTAAVPAGAAVGDRYIAMATANGWTIKHIYEWDGVQWTDTAPVEGGCVIVKELSDIYMYLNAQWSENNVPWLDPIISIFDNTAALPVAPSNGDRYIALITANGWTIDYVYEWNGNAWISTVPALGMMIFNNATGAPYLYTGAAWVQFNPLIAHDFGGVLHTADTIANIQTKVSDGSLLTSAAGEINAFTQKDYPVVADELVIEDSEDFTEKKKVTIDGIFSASPFWINPVISIFDNTSGLPS